MNILNEIAEKTRERIEKDKKEMPREDLIREIQQKKVQMLLNPLIQSETAKTPQLLSGIKKTRNVLHL